MDTISVVQYGLGPIGNRITAHMMQKKHLRIAGAVDTAPEKQGRDIGELADCSALGVSVTDTSEKLLADTSADIAMVTTVSDLASVTPLILELVSYGVNVVSTCEELSYPWKTDPERAGQIDAEARSNGVSVLSTGVNPGFLMDFLPLVLTGVCRSVTNITVERIQDAQYRRIPFQKKIGAGLSADEFKQMADRGVIRHVGLTESMHMAAAALGWDLDRTEDTVQPVVASEKTETENMTVDQGDVRGVEQTGKGWVKGQEVLTLVFRAAVGEPCPRDRISIEGTPCIDSVIDGGVNGDTATCAIAVNAISALVQAPPGLRTMADMPPISCLK